MEVAFTKPAHERDFRPWVATKGKSRIVGSHLWGDPTLLPHDLFTFVIENELAITDGFFGTVFAGGTFRSMNKRRHNAGKAVIAANRPGLTRAELGVNTAADDWVAGRPTPCAAALDAALAAWRATSPGATLTLPWTTPVPGRERKRRRR
jgi:hypothetical protein